MWTMSKPFFLVLPLLFLLGSCKTTDASRSTGSKESEIETREILVDEVTVVAAKDPEEYKRPVYRPSYTRRNDLLHTKLDLRFNWAKEQVIGKAYLRLTPLFYPTDSLILHAKELNIQKLSLQKADGSLVDLEYSYDSKEALRIQLDRSYTRKDTYDIYIEYDAIPRSSGGSSAISQDRGLYFINADGQGSGPQQIWTQGETESNSRWFPTIDRPNERCTQEMIITIEDRFDILTNGLRVDSKKNADGTRTEHWKMDLPHAPYLFMMAIGEFAVVKDDWKGMLLEYYVEPEYEEHAKAIFRYTPEMLTFFSELLDYPYPWAKYSQAIVREYVSGAMENTTGVIFGDFVQMTSQRLVDAHYGNEGIVAHEMIHHWFGDLVTCESWSNLPMNEAFANYGEYLWFEHQYGTDYADFHRSNEIQGYFAQANTFIHPLIFFGYDDKEDMFDQHSYNKGGAILHELRRYLGDEAFFAGLSLYLKRHEYTAVEGHDLRLAMEDVSGEDLNWFFDQWFYSAGHPQLSIEKSYDADKKELVIQIEQLQDFEEVPVFKLPLDMQIFHGTKKQEHLFWLDSAMQRFRIPMDKAPSLVLVDADRSLVGRLSFDKDVAERIEQYKYAPSVIDRVEALRDIQHLQYDNEEVVKTIKAALDDPFWGIRGNALRYLNIDPETDSKSLKRIQEMAQTDPAPSVREQALEYLTELGKDYALPSLQKAMRSDSSLMVLSTALQGLAKLDRDLAMKEAKGLEAGSSPDLLVTIASMYAETGDLQHADFFEKRYSAMRNYASFLFMTYYGKLLSASENTEEMTTKIDWFFERAINQSEETWIRYGAASAIKNLRKTLEKAGLDEAAQRCSERIEEIKEAETNPTIQRMYKSW